MAFELEFLIKLAESLKKYDIDVMQFDGASRVFQEAQKLLREKGPSYVLSIQELRETVLPKVANDARPLLFDIISMQLANLSPHDSLIIIGPYFFAAWDNDEYMEIFHSRFWIVDQDRGMFVGTSINGIGNKYATDYA